MRVILFVALILSGMMAAGSAALERPAKDQDTIWPEVKVVQTVATHETMRAGIEQAVDSADQEPAPSSFAFDTERITLRSVQELSLYDDRAAVIGKLGEPRGVTQDEFYGELAIFEYEQVRVVFFGEFIQSIDIPGEVGEVLLDDVLVPATLGDLKGALGEPDYVAEDGIVFQRDEALLKLFIDEETGNLDYISYYHLATV